MWAKMNHERWKARQIALGLRLISKASEQDRLRNLTPGQRAVEFVRRQSERTDEGGDAA